MTEREDNEKKYQKIAEILSIIGKVSDYSCYAIPLLIFIGRIKHALNYSQIGPFFDILAAIVVFPLTYIVFRIINFVIQKILILISAEVCKNILKDGYEEYKRAENEKAWQAFFEEEFGEEYERQRREQDRREREEREKQEKSSFTHESEETELMQDLKLFGLSLPFSKKELRKRYVEAMKKAHPDNGGSPEMAKRINTARARLEKFATG